MQNLSMSWVPNSPSWPQSNLSSGRDEPGAGGGEAARGVQPEGPLPGGRREGPGPGGQAGTGFTEFEKSVAI